MTMYSPQGRNNTTKKFLTNSDKSVFNLKWQVGGEAEENYQKSRRRSQSQSSSQSITPRSHSQKHHHHHHHRHHHHHHHHQDEQPDTTNDGSYSAPSTPPPPPPEVKQEAVVYYYPYAYPVMPVYQTTQPAVAPPAKKTAQTPGKLTQSQKSLNLAPERTKLKVEHHYVDSPHQAKKLIDELRRKGFVETGIETPGAKK